MNIQNVKKSLFFAFPLLFSACDSSHNPIDARKPDYPVASFIIKRWSPRAMSGQSISHLELNSLFEAARWAPSEYNNQPWRFVYAKRDTKHWDNLFNLLVDFNKEWAKNAAVLIVMVSKNTLQDGSPSTTHSFDAGAAWQNMALQATHMGLVSHGMAGFDYARAKKDLNIPDGYTIEAMCAIGKPGDKTRLPEYMQNKEKPGDRMKIQSFVSEGSFTFDAK